MPDSISMGHRRLVQWYPVPVPIRAVVPPSNSFHPKCPAHPNGQHNYCSLHVPCPQFHQSLYPWSVARQCRKQRRFSDLSILLGGYSHLPHPWTPPSVDPLPLLDWALPISPADSLHTVGCALPQPEICCLPPACNARHLVVRPQSARLVSVSQPLTQRSSPLHSEIRLPAPLPHSIPLLLTPVVGPGGKNPLLQQVQ